MTEHCRIVRPGMIAILVYDFRGSGVVRNALRIAAAAGGGGLDVQLWPIRCQGELLGAIPAGLPVEPICDGRRAGLRDMDSLASVPALARAIARRRPALLFSAGNHTHLYAALALRRASETDVRLVGRASNAVVAAGLSSVAVRSAAWPIERFQYSAMDRIVAVSEELADALIGEIGIAPSRIDVVPNGVDVAQIRAGAAEPVHHPFFAPGAPPVVLGIGRLSRQKNFEGLLRAFKRARRHRPMRLLLLGAGTVRRRRRLLELALRLGVAEDFALAGFVANPYPYLARAGLFVLNSRWEGASNVLLEALACGCPVVAARAPTGVAEVMRNGAFGPLVPVGDDTALAAAMLDRLARPRNAEALQRRAGDYDIGRSLASYVEILSEEAARATA
jgi:glycosyltransferase involved in cell wall biosynthesis